MDVRRSPAPFCGVCGEEVADPEGYSLTLWERQYLADRFGPLPDDARITMCAECFEHLSALETDRNELADEDMDRHFGAMAAVLDEVPEESLFVASERGRRFRR